MLRAYFRFDRRLLGKLSQCAYQPLKEFFQKTLNKKEAVPGTVISVQTFGDLVNFHPHLHCLVTILLATQISKTKLPMSVSCGKKIRQKATRSSLEKSAVGKESILSRYGYPHSAYQPQGLPKLS